MLTKVCCFRLNTLGVVVGWLGMLVSVLVGIVHVFLIAKVDPYSNPPMHNSTNNNPIFELVHTTVIHSKSFSLPMILLNLIASSLLVLGTLKERHLLLLPWLMMYAPSLGFALLPLILLWFIFPQPLCYIYMGIYGSVLALGIYIYCGIYALYNQIQLSKIQQLRLNRVELGRINHQDYLSAYNT